jgi:dihydropteroate synthase
MNFQARRNYHLRLGSHTLELGRKTLLMGILNVTPDSFSDGGRFFEPDAAIARAWEIHGEGADILDVGGESTRPDSEGVSADEELHRILPVLDALRSGSYPLPVSVDTSKPEVAQAALERGVSLINDIRSLRDGRGVARSAAMHGAGLILVHMRGTPRDMQKLPWSPDILGELDTWAGESVARAESCGVSRDRIILDPGIGFGKSVDQNLKILRNLNRLAAAGFPILVGTSRKSFIGAVLGRPDGDRVWGTGATVAASILFGAHVVRVHDVAPMRDVARVTDALLGERASQ